MSTRNVDRLPESPDVPSVVIGVLSEQLPVIDRRRFLHELPESLTGSASRTTPPLDDTLETFYERVAQRAALPLEAARTQSKMVCRSLAEALDPGTRAWLLTRLPAGYAAHFFAPRELTAPGAAP